MEKVSPRVELGMNNGDEYGSDTAKVKEILIESAVAHKDVLKFPLPLDGI